MPVYSLFLNTATTNVNYSFAGKSTNASVFWNINYDDLFQGDNKIYKNCRVRFQLISTRWTTSATDWDNYCGYITTNLASKYQQQRGLNGTVLGMIHPQIPAIAAIQTATIGYNISTLQTTGVDINVPQGFSPLYINLYTDSTSQALISWTTEPQWSIFLTFELY